MRKDFKNLDIYAAFQPANGAEWQKANGISADWKTPEHIEVKPVYTKEDLEGMEHLGYAAGLPPYLRGPYSVMYTLRPWTIRQYAGFAADILQRIQKASKMKFSSGQVNYFGRILQRLGVKSYRKTRGVYYHVVAVAQKEIQGNCERLTGRKTL